MEIYRTISNDDLEEETQQQNNISHAKRIQNALFQKLTLDESGFQDQFILDLPKDQVGGDFYMFSKIQSKTVVLVGDCTGHGVSGALMTALCTSVVAQMLQTYKTLSPSLVLEKVDSKLKQMLTTQDGEVTDGMDATLIFIDQKNNTLRYANIGQSFYLVTDDQVDMVKGGKNDFGMMTIEREDQSMRFERGSMLYLLSDGLKDQFNGLSGKKFGRKRVEEMFEEIHDHTCEEQYSIIKEKLNSWKNGEPQTDDMMIIGLRL